MSTQQPSPFPRSFHVVAKPVGSLCNLDCTYCYYLHKEHLLPDWIGRVADDLLEEFIRQYIAGQEIDEVVFNWHGGEPALVGLDFCRRVVELQQRHAIGKRIKNEFQTNGVLLDESWCEFFKQHGFSVGLSIDGPKHLHDRVRVGKGGSPTFDQVYRTARLLQKYGVPFNPMAVVSSVNARHPAEVYRFLTEDLGCSRIQWLPCAEPKDFCSVAPGRWDTARMPIVGTPAARPGHPDSVVTDWSVDPDDWGEFLCQTFELWFKNDLGRVFVNSDRQRQFGLSKRNTLTDHCKRCPYCFACHGECPKNRFIKSPEGQPGQNYLCPGLKRFFAYADPYLRQLAAQVLRKRAARLPESSVQTVLDY